ncbi:radical SAM protein, partial [Lachnospiraceae bacterium OttesenSCG-928-D06]|nr:radical SAM protein [Lachnospiraceae bacterium OttesenSCG-928-D06]
MEDKNVKGRIFDIQRYSIHDGDGIRTIVFLKGCALRCRWCSNPESQDRSIQTMIVQGKEKIIGRDVTVEEVLFEVKKDRSYYNRSGGGLTLSGGESLCQPEFATALLRAAREIGITTALESTAYAKDHVIENILPYLNQ